VQLLIDKLSQSLITQWLHQHACMSMQWATLSHHSDASVALFQPSLSFLPILSRVLQPHAVTCAGSPSTVHSNWRFLHLSMFYVFHCSIPVHQSSSVTLSVYHTLKTPLCHLWHTHLVFSTSALCLLQTGACKVKSKAKIDHCTAMEKSHAIWDLTELPPDFILDKHGTQFSEPRGMQVWVNLVVFISQNSIPA